MVQINFAAREVNCKIVYYGPGMSGKTTNLEIVHQKVPAKNKGDLTSIATEGERTLFFDFLPLDIGTVSGMSTKFQLYTVPGQVYYSSTRKLVLRGVDGIVFVADSQKDKLKENIESMQDLRDNLASYNIDIEKIPLVIQYNKRDMPDVMDINSLEKEINTFNVPYLEAVAITGEGVIKTLKVAAKMVLEQLNKKTGSAASVKSSKAVPAKLKEKIYICEIDNEKILKEDFDKFCLTQMKISSKMGRSLEDLKEKEKRGYLERFVNQIIVVQESKKRGITVEESETKEKIKQFSAKIGSDDKFDEYLKKRNIALEDIKDEVVKNILTAKLIRMLFSDYKERMSVSDSEVEEYYNSNKAEFEGEFDMVKGKIVNILKNRKRRDLFNNFYETIREGKEITYTG